MQWISVNDRLPEKGLRVKVKGVAYSMGGVNKVIFFTMSNGRSLDSDWISATHWKPHKQQEGSDDS